MASSDTSMKDLILEAERLGKEQEDIDKQNRKRRAKGRKPLPDLQERKDQQVLLRRYRTDDPTVIDSEDAISLYKKRKLEMEDDPDDDLDEPEDPPMPAPKAKQPTKAARSARAKEAAQAPSGDPIADADEAIRQAAAARRVEDLKNGRIDHVGNWSGGQRLEGGDKTDLTPGTGRSEAEPADGQADKGTFRNEESSPPASELPPVDSLAEFRADLYQRLAVSFEALEKTLSDLQGRVGEIVTASTPAGTAEDDGDEADQDAEGFSKWLSLKTPVVFDVNGTKMTFDAICVFHAAPCLTIVSNIDSAKISPKPGAQLKLTYEMEGRHYVDDPVTFLGTRFDLPMFGLSFVGFIRDAESALMDVDMDPGEPQET